MTLNAQGSAPLESGAATNGQSEQRKALMEQLEQFPDKETFLLTASTLTDEQKRALTDDWAGFLRDELERRSGNANTDGAQMTAGAAAINAAAAGIGAVLRSPMSLAKGAGGLAKVSIDQFREGRVKRAFKGQEAAFKQASAILGGLSEHDGFTSFVMGNQELNLSSADVAKEMRPGGKLEGRFNDFNQLLESDPKLKSMMEGLSESVDAFGRDGAELVRLTGKYPKMELEFDNVKAPIAAHGFESTLTERGEILDKSLSGMPLPEFDDKKSLVSFKAVGEKLEDMMESIKKLIETLKSMIRIK